VPFRPPANPIKPDGVCFCVQGSAEAGWCGQYLLDAFGQVRERGQQGHAGSSNLNNTAGSGAGRPLFSQSMCCTRLREEARSTGRSIFRNRCPEGAGAAN
jgi:hypothetical protein